MVHYKLEKNPPFMIDGNCHNMLLGLRSEKPSFKVLLFIHSPCKNAQFIVFYVK